MKKIAQFLKRNLFPLLIVLITTYLSLINYKPGTWLSGWDTLHPEFNFPLNFKRIIDGVWREEQGLGAVAGHSHMADLPRVIILFLLSFVFPTNTLRYLFIFLTLITGPLGIYYFLEKVILKNHSDLQKKISSFLGSLFYLLNLGTLQHFYVPFEMFNVQFAAIGWLFLFATRFLEKQNKKDFILFSITTFLATPQAYAATLWYAYFLGLALYLLTFCLPTLRKRDLKIGKRAILLIGTTLIINSYWLLPNFYFLANHASDVPKAKINRLFSGEAFLHSQNYGNIKDTAILKNFLFSWAELSGQERFKYLLNEWIAHLKNPLVLAIGYACFFLLLIGLMLSFKNRNQYTLPLFSLFLFSFIFVVDGNSFSNRISILKEAMRFPFTKFSILLMFSYAVYFALAQSAIFALIQKKSKCLGVLFSVFCLLLLTLYMLPAFKGNLISPSMKIKIPDEYFQMFAWLNKQEEGRIAKFPVHSFWGWVYHDWGFQGAGFVWFGIKQPILERDFDRWTPYNEQTYHELSYAIYSQNLPLLEQFLDKYQIHWILLDESIIAPGSEDGVLFFDETKEMFSDSEKINLAKSFGDKLKVYQVELNSIIGQSIQLAETENLPLETSIEILSRSPSKLNHLIVYKTLPKQIIFLNFDQLRLLPELCSQPDNNQVFGVTPEQEINGFRLFAKNGVACVRIPLSLFLKGTQNILVEVKFDYQPKTDEKPSVCLFDKRLLRCAGQRFTDNYFELGGNLDNYLLQFSLDAVGSTEENSILYKNINLAVFEPVGDTEAPNLIQEANHYDITDLNRKPETCSHLTPQHYNRNIIDEDGMRYIEYTSLKGSSCDHFAYPQLPHYKGYALVIESRNLEGLPLTLCLTNHQTRRCDLYTNLTGSKSFQKEVFLIPPMGESGIGYDININNYSIGKFRSTNHLKSIQIFPIEYDWFKPTNRLPEQDNFVALHQSFEKNWFAFEYKKPFSIRPLKHHFEVNGWANGWVLKDSQLPIPNSQLYFFFLPQLLEYFGFLLLLAFSCSSTYFLLKY